MNKMKKICYITTVSLTLDMFVLEAAKYIHQNTDWDITFVCNNDDEFAKRLPEYIKFHPIKMERGISITGVKAMLNMIKFFKEQKFDLIQYSTPNASLYAAIAGKIAGVPVRLYCQWGMAFVAFSGIKRKIFKTLEKTTCALSTCIEPDSDSNLRFSHMEGLYPKTMGKVIWNGSACGVNLNKFNITQKAEYRTEIRNKYDIPKDAFIFGYVGRITRDKGINELFEAFKKLTENNKSVYLLMIGHEEKDKNVDRDLYEWSKTNEYVIYTGFTNVVEKYMASMDCYVLPSYREGFGMGVIEAEAMGTPVIVTNIPGPIDAMRENETGLIVEKKDAQLLYEAMKKIYTDRRLHNRLQSNARKYVEENFEQSCFFSEMLVDRKQLLKN